MSHLSYTRILVSLLTIMLLSAAAGEAQTTWYVDAAAPPGGDGSAGSPFDTIQAGIDAALDGDTVLVLDGTYTGDGNRDLDFGGRLITVQSENGPANCIIDCESSGRGLYFHNGETADAVLEGFTVSDGSANYGGAVYCDSSDPTIINCTFKDSAAAVYGGGMYCCYAAPTLTSCQFIDNRATWYGGGMYCHQASPSVTECHFIDNSARDGGGAYNSNHSNPTTTNCQFIDNRAGLYGGGLVNAYSSSPVLTNCIFTDNKAPYDSGMLNYSGSSPIITRCMFINNRVIRDAAALGNWISCHPTVTDCTFIENSARYYGGGITNSDSCSPTVTNCMFEGNSALDGGAMYNQASSPTVSSCRFVNNKAGRYAGAVCDYLGSSSTLTNCLFVGNSARTNGAVVIAYSLCYPILTNCTLVGNVARTSAAIWNYYSESTLANCILRDDSADEIAGPALVTYSNVQGGWFGEGNIDADPLLGDGFELLPGSPCVNAGSNYIPDLPAEDIAGAPRIQECRVDMGAYESPHEPVEWPDCNDNGVNDDCEIYEETCEDCNSNRIPDECDIADGTSDDYDLNAVPDECDPDCNENGIPDACDLDCAIGDCASHPLGCGASDDYDVNGLPDECDPDCNGNGVPDACDIDCGTGDCSSHPLGCAGSNDCQPDGIPDECQLGSEPADSVAQDDCAYAEPVGPDIVYTGTTNGSTNDGAAGCGASSRSPDVWYVYTPAEDGTLTASLCGSAYDTVLSVHGGCPGNTSNEIACNDDSCGLQSEVTLSVFAGESYLIRIAGYSGVTGDFMMLLTGPACQLADNDCNDNGVPDECDIVDGTSADANENGVPDECECLGGCEHSVVLYDDWGDGWNGCTLDVLVNGVVVLDDITLPYGPGPMTYDFCAYTGDTITTEFTPVIWQEECSYYIYDGAATQICADGLEGTVPGGCTCTGNCPP